MVLVVLGAAVRDEGATFEAEAVEDRLRTAALLVGRELVERLSLVGEHPQPPLSELAVSQILHGVPGVVGEDELLFDDLAGNRVDQRTNLFEALLWMVGQGDARIEERSHTLPSTWS